MSIETFFEKHPADSYFANEVSWPGKENKSTVRFMADILIKEGREGLVEIGPAFNDAMNTRNPSEAQRLIYPYVNNSTAIYLGVGLITIEETLRDTYFDPQVFNSIMSMAYTGTYLTPAMIQIEEREELTPEEMSLMTKVAMSDKTFSFFFGDGFPVLPKTLKDFYITSEVIPDIRKYMLPYYETRTKFLIEANGHKPF